MSAPDLDKLRQITDEAATDYDRREHTRGTLLDVIDGLDRGQADTAYYMRTQRQLVLATWPDHADAIEAVYAPHKHIWGDE